ERIRRPAATAAPAGAYRAVAEPGRRLVPCRDRRTLRPDRELVEIDRLACGRQAQAGTRWRRGPMNIEERLRRRLDALAAPSPGAALEARVRAAHRRRVRRLAAGMAALALAALVPWLVLRPEPGGDPPTAGAGPAPGSMDPADASRRQGQVQAIDLAQIGRASCRGGG